MSTGLTEGLTDDGVKSHDVLTGRGQVPGGEPTGGVDRSADEGRQGRVEEFFLTVSL